MTMADRIVVLNGGRIEQVGTPLELFDRPANRFVAGFIGSPAMNFIDGRCTPRGFEAQGAVLPLPSMDWLDVADQPMSYGIRPEHFEQCQPGQGVAAQVQGVEPLGSDTQLNLRIGHAGVVVLLHERLAIEPGETMHLRPRLEAVHLFDAQSGQRLGPR